LAQYLHITGEFGVFDHARALVERARDAAGTTKIARIRVANGYALTISGSLAVIGFLASNRVPGGYYTPSRLCGADLVQRLPGSGSLRIDQVAPPYPRQADRVG
jgi:short subunit dehydrogenase-like uncharacterized protein